MTIKQLYAGFDTLEVAFLGALPTEALEVFREAKQEAAKQQERQLVTIGPGNVKGHIASHGLTGGYAFYFDIPDPQGISGASRILRTPANGILPLNPMQAPSLAIAIRKPKNGS